MKINLISVDNGVGLTQDINICKDILHSHKHKCTFHDVKAVNTPHKADINIFFEILNHKFYHKAAINLFFPNPEWFWFKNELNDIDLVLCKTRDAQNIFNRLGCRTIYTSFTSRDMQAHVRKERKYLHLAGQSMNKGTKQVVATWTQDMPELMLCSTKYTYNIKGKNIAPIFDRLSENDLTYLMNEAAFHLCPSDYEGFGHYIWEAKSCGGIVLTTNAEPMSDFVQDGKDGFLIPYRKMTRQQMAVLKHITSDGLLETIKRTEQLTDGQIREMSQASRRSWEENDRFFRKIFIEIINNVKPVSYVPSDLIKKQETVERTLLLDSETP